MANADINNLQNIQPLELNTTIFNNGTDMPQSIMSLVTTYVGDTWFIVSVVGLFLFFMWLFYRREEGFGYDISRSGLLSSAFCFLITAAFFLSDIITAFEPLIWFGTLMFLFLVGVKALKDKNQ